MVIGNNGSAVLYITLHFPLSQGREGHLYLTWFSAMMWEDNGGTLCTQGNL